MVGKWQMSDYYLKPWAYIVFLNRCTYYKYLGCSGKCTRSKTNFELWHRHVLPFLLSIHRLLEKGTETLLDRHTEYSSTCTHTVTGPKAYLVHSEVGWSEVVAPLRHAVSLINTGKRHRRQLTERESPAP